MQQEISSSVTSNLPRMKQFAGASDIFTSKPYSSIFFHTDRSGASPTSSLNASSNDQSATATAAAAMAAFSRLMSQHKDLTNRFSLCMAQLQKTFREAETLRQENTNLRVANLQLTEQMSILLEAAALQAAASIPEPVSSPVSFSSGSGISSGEKKMKEREVEGVGWEEGVENTSESPTSVIEHERSQQKSDAGRVSLPKSISVRSNGYLKISPGGSSHSGGSSSSGGSISGGSSSEAKPKPNRGAASKTHSDNAVSGPAQQQKVYVRGGNKKEGPIELEVFNQGMFKTELCNKWQETGNCPYGDHCQFAHGIQELRPVIRHPRYKTEVCRMVLAGDPCPYGHRCHFRHALTQEEQLMLPMRIE